MLEIFKAMKISSPLEEWVICHEAHKEKGFHVHAFLKYFQKVQQSPTKWDFVHEGKTYHGHYVPAKCWRAVSQYCTKDGNYIANFDVQRADKKKSCQRERNELLLTRDLTELVREGEISLFQYPTMKAAKEAFMRDTAIVLPRAEEGSQLKNLWGKILLLMPVKQRHYWIWSRKPSTGKTSFLRDLALLHPVHWYGYNEHFQNIHCATQFVFLDEYSTAHLKVTQLNQMCDGTYPYPVKGENPVTLFSPTVLVCSNKPVEEVYPNQFLLVQARFNIINVDP